MVTIGILQWTQNLDDAVDGFRQGLTALGRQVHWLYRNAEGNEAAARKYAAELQAAAVNLIFACGTPAARAAKATGLPVVFTPVFDPVGAGLVASLERPGENATGMAGMVPAEAKVAFIKELLPQVTQLGVLYHQEDDNARVEMQNFQAAATGFFTLLPLPITEAAELSRLGDRLTMEIEALFLPIGRVVEENFPTIVYYTDLRRLPVIASHGPNVAAGALGALVANHARLGQACARQAAAILDGRDPGEIPVGRATQPDILLNATAADTLGLTLPETLRQKAHEIIC